MDIEFEAVIWQYEGPGAWCFVTLPPAAAAQVAACAPAREFGLVRVRVRVGGATWRTSLFKDKQKRSYLLPLKAAVRRSLGLRAGERISIELRLEIQSA